MKAGGCAIPGRRPHRNQGNVAQVFSNRVTMQEPQGVPLQCGSHPLLQPLFVQRDPSHLEKINSFPVDIYAQHVMAG